MNEITDKNCFLNPYYLFFSHDCPKDTLFVHHEWIIGMTKTLANSSRFEKFGVLVQKLVYQTQFYPPHYGTSLADIVILFVDYLSYLNENEMTELINLFEELFPEVRLQGTLHDKRWMNVRGALLILNAFAVQTGIAELISSTSKPIEKFHVNETHALIGFCSTLIDLFSYQIVCVRYDDDKNIPCLVCDCDIPQDSVIFRSVDIEGSKYCYDGSRKGLHALASYVCDGDPPNVLLGRYVDCPVVLYMDHSIEVSTNAKVQLTYVQSAIENIPAGMILCWKKSSKQSTRSAPKSRQVGVSPKQAARSAPKARQVGGSSSSTTGIGRTRASSSSNTITPVGNVVDLTSMDVSPSKDDELTSFCDNELKIFNAEKRLDVLNDRRRKVLEQITSKFTHGASGDTEIFNIVTDIEEINTELIDLKTLRRGFLESLIK